MTQSSAGRKECWSIGVSVVMAVYNGGETIGKSIESVLQQSYADWELIVVDDGSTDSTAEVVRSFTDPRIRLYSRSHAGRVAARNYGLSRCHSNLIAILDADDLMTRNRLEIQRQAALRAPEIGVHAGWYRVVDTGKLQVSPLSNRSITRFLWSGSSIGHSTVMFNKDAIPIELTYPDDLNIGCEDLSLFLLLSATGVKFRCLPKVIMFYSDTASESTKTERALRARAYRDELASKAPDDVPKQVKRLIRKAGEGNLMKFSESRKISIVLRESFFELRALLEGVKVLKSLERAAPSCSADSLKY